MMGSEWLIEDVDENEKRCYRIVERIYATQSKYQVIEIIKLANQGVSLILDGFARVFESDEYIFHEALVHPCLSLHASPKNILLIGDGDGGGIREILKYPEIDSIDWVEIDEDVVNACKTFLPTLDPVMFDSPKLKTHWMDGVKFIKETRKKYDCIFISVTEQMKGNVSDPFYTHEVISQIPNLLTENGICVQSAGVATPNMSSKLIANAKRHKRFFKDVKVYTVGLPSFGLDWGFCISSHKLSSIPKLRNDLKFIYYNDVMHSRMFAIPPYLHDPLHYEDK